MIKKKKEPGNSKIHEPLSSYFPSSFKVDDSTLQNITPRFHGNGAVYVRNDEYPERPEGTE